MPCTRSLQIEARVGRVRRGEGPQWQPQPFLGRYDTMYNSMHDIYSLQICNKYTIQVSQYCDEYEYDIVSYEY